MSKKDYRLIAEVIRNQYNYDARGGNVSWKLAVRNVAVAMSEKLQADNPRFDRDKFLKACGISD